MLDSSPKLATVARVQFSLPKARLRRDEVVVVLSWKRLKSSLPNVAAVTVVLQVSPHMRGHQPLHPARQVAVLVGPHHQMKMG